ncbi:MAG: class I SAM-dependent methyltransferase [Proteobacteria bacterium]|nr:class I SAM-dependent methyltransferase [Pseudomonadota bacterium]MBU1686225.1 class I SAM-dependent methyltransferase [Pseudomonadota bacterium]
MREAYSKATAEILSALENGGECLDCGANTGHWCQKISSAIDFKKDRYYGVEWDGASVGEAQGNGLNVQPGDLNKKLPYEDEKFTCVFALSVLEHLLNGCHFIHECRRVLKTGGTLVLLTPNISTYFTALLILMGKMPSSGPHPDSAFLLKQEELIKVSSDGLIADPESDTPIHRHLVVFSYRVLRTFLEMNGFSQVLGYGFGVYPFPNFIQPLMEKIDPYHCHQMVFIAKK